MLGRNLPQVVDGRLEFPVSKYGIAHFANTLNYIINVILREFAVSTNFCTAPLVLTVLAVLKKSSRISNTYALVKYACTILKSVSFRIL